MGMPPGPWPPCPAPAPFPGESPDSDRFLRVSARHLLDQHWSRAVPAGVDRELWFVACLEVARIDPTDDLAVLLERSTR